MSLAPFIERCDAYCQKAGVSRSWLSKRLFADHRRITDLADEKSDVGVIRLARAERDLAQLERELDADATSAAATAQLANAGGVQ